jgi:hypothetical protein
MPGKWPTPNLHTCTHTHKGVRAVVLFVVVVEMVSSVDIGCGGGCG